MHPPRPQPTAPQHGGLAGPAPLAAHVLPWAHLLPGPVPHPLRPHDHVPLPSPLARQPPPHCSTQTPLCPASLLLLHPCSHAPLASPTRPLLHLVPLALRYPCHDRAPATPVLRLSLLALCYAAAVAAVAAAAAVAVADAVVAAAVAAAVAAEMCLLPLEGLAAGCQLAVEGFAEGGVLWAGELMDLELTPDGRLLQAEELRAHELLSRSRSPKLLLLLVLLQVLVLVVVLLFSGSWRQGQQQEWRGMGKRVRGRLRAAGPGGCRSC
eukprot:scaffold78876_cov17-Tisochrysis_lutea.AAC.2